VVVVLLVMVSGVEGTAAGRHDLPGQGAVRRVASTFQLGFTNICQQQIFKNYKPKTYRYANVKSIRVYLVFKSEINGFFLWIYRL
jgi:hypothetical protein